MNSPVGGLCPVLARLSWDLLCKALFSLRVLRVWVLDDSPCIKSGPVCSFLCCLAQLTWRFLTGRGFRASAQLARGFSAVLSLSCMLCEVDFFIVADYRCFGICDKCPHKHSGLNDQSDPLVGRLLAYGVECSTGLCRINTMFALESASGVQPQLFEGWQSQSRNSSLNLFF